MSDFIDITRRLFIRKIEDGDKDLVFGLHKESAFFSRLSKFIKDEEEQKEICWSNINGLGIYNAMIFLKDSGEFVGKICMQDIESDLPELGIDILKAHQNCGYGPEAVVAFSNWYCEKFGINEVKVRIKEKNSHSRYVFEKLGAVYDKASSYFSNEELNKLREMLPDTDISVLLDENIRDYRLKLPILCDER